PIVVSFVSALGVQLTTCDDCFFERQFGFNFPYYGQNQTSGFLSSNGYITFGSGDLSNTESVSVFQNFPRISPFFDDLIDGGGLWVNDTISGKFVVTWSHTKHFCCFGDNTIQVQLYSNGTIVFAYNGITALTNGQVVGLNPAPGSNSQLVDYRTSTN